MCSAVGRGGRRARTARVPFRDPVPRPRERRRRDLRHRARRRRYRHPGSSRRAHDRASCAGRLRSHRGGRSAPTARARAGVVRSAVQRRALGARDDRSRGRRVRDRRGRRAVTPLDLGRDRSVVARRRAVHAVWLRARSSRVGGRRARRAPCTRRRGSHLRFARRRARSPVRDRASSTGSSCSCRSCIRTPARRPHPATRARSRCARADVSRSEDLRRSLELRGKVPGQCVV